jgi:D-alanyl-D-alanine carboxypeptidase
MNQLKLQSILDKSIDYQKVHGCSFTVRQGNQTWTGVAGNFESSSPFFIASATKLYVTALFFQFLDKKLLSLEQGLSDFLDKELLDKLHVYKQVDFSSKLTVRHLLAHTSGLPDYFQGKNTEGLSLLDRLSRGEDVSWSPESAVEMSKIMTPHFEPGAPKKAFYSDTNFQLLGLIAEKVSGLSLSDCLEQNIFQPLDFQSTYLYQHSDDTRPKKLYFKKNELDIPKAMVSFWADGGIVSTSQELNHFLHAFFNGFFFPKTFIAQYSIWNSIFFPMKSGVGFHRFRLPWFFDPFRGIPDLIGHSGLSGTFAFYAPEKDLYVTGTVNQVAHPETSFRLAIKLIQAVK